VSEGRRLVLVRHGVTAWNREGRFQGHQDPPLNDAGREEARLVAARLALDSGLRPARLVSSTLARAMETAAIIGEACAVPVEPDDRLIEIGAGAWEGRTHAELAVDDAATYAAWQAGGDVRPPGGEPVDAAAARVAEVVDSVVAAGAPLGTVAIVSHGGLLRLLARHLLTVDEDRAWALDCDNAAVGACRQLDGGAWQVERWNDAHHLLGRMPTHVDEADGRPLAL
jgi:broad specificity phosphatase PhoE